MISIETMQNRIVQGDCVQVMKELPAESVHLIVTDPPYLVNYVSRDGRGVPNDDNSKWLRPAFAGMYRVLKENSFCVSFYGWNKVGLFNAAWRAAGFRLVGHLVFVKPYSSSSGVVKYQHEQAYVLAKGKPKSPRQLIGDVIPWEYSGNRLHPTQKPLGILKPIIQSFSEVGSVVLDPFAGSGSSCLASKALFRQYIGIELDKQYASIAQRRLEAVF
jgi:site-specific DNA-methyltransferase (adenine-specific)